MNNENDIYGDQASFGGQPVELPTQDASSQKNDTFPLKIHFTGGSVDIISPLPKEKFLVALISEITAKGNDPAWSGWFGFRVKPKNAKTKSEKTVSIMVKQIVGVEEL